MATVEIEELMLKKEEKTVVEYILIEERPIPEEIFNPLMMEKSHFLIGD